MFARLMFPGNKKALVVDDEESLRTLVAMALRHFGFQSITAGSAREAVAILENHPDVWLLLTDIVMPGISGDSLASWALKHRPHMRIIMMSGTEERIHPGIPFLQKPFTLLELRKALDRVARQDESVRPEHEA